MLFECWNDSVGLETTIVSSNDTSDFAVAIATVSLSSVAFLLNLISLIIFVCLYKDLKTAETFSFALLSVFESTLNLFFTLTGLLILMSSFETCYMCKILTLLCLSVANISILIRNWWILLLSVIRCLLIVRPFKFGTIFSSKFYRIVFVIIFLFSLFLSLARLVFELIPLHFDFYCVNPEFVQLLMRFHFVFQGAVPPVGVMGSTIVLVYFLIARGQRSSNFSHGKATLTTLLLALLFSCTEFPSMIMNIASKFDTPPTADLLLIIDSTFNFFVYVVANRHFRLKMKSFVDKTVVCKSKQFCGVCQTESLLSDHHQNRKYISVSTHNKTQEETLVIT